MRRKKNNKKTFLFKILLILFCVFIIFFIIKNSIARYRSNANVTGNISAAMYIIKEGFQSMNLNLDSMEPRVEPYEYTFTISNNDGVSRTEVNLEYNLSIVTTTNLPLNYELYMNGSTNSAIANDEIKQDEDLTYFRYLTVDKENFEFTSDKTNSYKLLVYFPETYRAIEYQDVIEGIEIRVDSKQSIN